MRNRKSEEGETNSTMPQIVMNPAAKKNGTVPRMSMNFLYRTTKTYSRRRLTVTKPELSPATVGMLRSNMSTIGTTHRNADLIVSVCFSALACVIEGETAWASRLRSAPLFMSRGG